MLLLALASLALCARARSLSSATDDASISGVIPSPNQAYGDELELQRTSAEVAHNSEQAHAAQQPSDEASSIPVYVSPFARAERSASAGPAVQFERQESSQAPPNYAPRPTQSDLKTSASYGK